MTGHADPPESKLPNTKVVSGTKSASVDMEKHGALQYVINLI